MFANVTIWTLSLPTTARAFGIAFATSAGSVRIAYTVVGPGFCANAFLTEFPRSPKNHVTSSTGLFAPPGLQGALTLSGLVMAIAVFFGPVAVLSQAPTMALSPNARVAG